MWFRNMSPPPGTPENADRWPMDCFHLNGSSGLDARGGAYYSRFTCGGLAWGRGHGGLVPLCPEHGGPLAPPFCRACGRPLPVEVCSEGCAPTREEVCEVCFAHFAYLAGLSVFMITLQEQEHRAACRAFEDKLDRIVKETT